MQPVKIFLASSGELSDERNDVFRIVADINKQHSHLHLEIVEWEIDLPSGNYGGKRIQDAINPLLRECQIAYVLFYSKAGEFTIEELDLAQATCPKVFVYFKTGFSTTDHAKYKAYGAVLEIRAQLEKANQMLFKDYDGMKAFELHFKGDLNKHLLHQFPKPASDRVTQSHPVTEPPASDDHPHALTPAPFRSEVFLGREADLQGIHDDLTAPQGVVETLHARSLLLVNGVGGVGKTTLASHYYFQREKEYAHVAWLFCEPDIAQALLLLAKPLKLEFEPEATTNQRLDLLLAALADLQGPCLLILDNANDLDDLDANYQRLRQLPNFHLLLTTRITNYRKAHTRSVSGLPPDEALELFETHLSSKTLKRTLNEAERAIFHDIRKAVDGNTLVLELLAKNLYVQNRLGERYTLPQLLEDLQSRGLLQLSHSKAVDTDYGPLRHARPEEIIAAMYDLRPLPEAEAVLLSQFSVLPAERIPFPLLQSLLPDTPDLEDLLISLTQKGWLEHTDTDASFKCSPVVQGVVRHQRPGWWEECKGLVDVLFEKLDYETGTGHLLNASYEAADTYARLGAAVLEAYRERPYRGVSVLSEYIGNYHITTGDTERGLFFFEKKIEFIQNLLKNDPENADTKSGLAISYSKLGTTHTILGDLDKALGFYEKYNQLMQSLHADHPQHVEFKNNLAISYSKFGETHTDLGDLDKALGFYEKYNQLMESLHADHPQNVEFKNNWAISYEKLGEAHTDLGDLDKALVFFEKYNQLRETLHTDHPQNVGFKNGLAVSYEKLGNTHTALGDLEKALGFYEKEVQLFESLHTDHPQNVGFKNGLAISYWKLGAFHRDQLHDPAKARVYFEQAEALWAVLVEVAPGFVQFRRNLEAVRRHLAGL
ncbi:MAG: tetratricopeptide repeat protein [Bacteroidetes bacterium]|nr:tetratricopeptide repeat protein [Bacteroidota bacterium]